MKKLLFDGLEEMLVGIGIPLAFTTASAIFHVVFGGWHGIRHFLSLWAAGAGVSVIAYWGCQHYGITGPLMAICIWSASIFSYTILYVLFHPAVKDALIQRMKMEILTRGRVRDSKE